MHPHEQESMLQLCQLAVRAASSPREAEETSGGGSVDADTDVAAHVADADDGAETDTGTALVSGTDVATITAPASARAAPTHETEADEGGGAFVF